MKKKVFSLFLVIILAFCTSCAKPENKTVKIAVMGDKDNFYPDYLKGIEKAIDELNQEYAGSGFTFEYTVCDDKGSYELGTEDIANLDDDKSVTAVIGAVDMDINRTAAHVFGESNRLFIVPHALYDSVYENNNYDTVLSLTVTAKKMGQTLGAAASNETGAKRWAVCTDDDEFSMSEMRGFLEIDKTNGINIVDCCDIVTLMSDFDKEINRLKSLGVEGLVIFPGETYSSAELLSLVRKIRWAAPGMVLMGDSSFDDSARMLTDPSLVEAMTGFIIVIEFQKSSYDAAEVGEVNKRREAFAAEYGSKFDYWYLHAYNMTKMIGETAAQNNTADGAEIARILHKNGYDGLCQTYVFDGNGSQQVSALQYYILQSDGSAKEITIDQRR